MKKTHIQGSNIEKFCSNAAAGRRALKNLDPTPPPAAGLSKIWLRRRRRPPGSQKFGSDAAAGRRALKNLAPTPPPAAGLSKIWLRRRRRPPEVLKNLTPSLRRRRSRRRI